MNNREGQNELCRSRKTPEEIYKIALSYERGNKYAKSYVSTNTEGGTWSTPSGGGLQIKQEPIRIIRGDTETHGNEEEDHILDADLQEEGHIIKRVRNASTKTNPGLRQSI